ncbi:SPOR domain-containing protein [Thermophagus xiamenensis]|uniref:Sporulation related domain-containing protein n=1 Tax=Thermophagus xiamenensis TaxID=385682 RepID=A0A1I2AZ16_9BACT|nr:SPOR domain-containing protein [Thermophagus xiamenensis]SFE49184.1 Sporulation related domain-containing protein [Thermophagus xiamenensis]
MVKLIQYFSVALFLLVQPYVVRAKADKLANLRSSKKIVAVSDISEPYFAIQILALEKPPQNPSFFKNIEKAYEYRCSDGYVRYTVGQFNTKEEALQNISRIKALGYVECFVVDIRHFRLKNSETASTFVPDGQTLYTIQLAAYRYPVYTSEFKEFDEVMEFYMDDRIYRYTVGAYKGDEALQQLKKVKDMGYQHAYLVPLEKYKPYRIE